MVARLSNREVPQLALGTGRMAPGGENRCGEEPHRCFTVLHVGSMRGGVAEQQLSRSTLDTHMRVWWHMRQMAVGVARGRAAGTAPAWVRCAGGLPARYEVAPGYASGGFGGSARAFLNARRASNWSAVEPPLRPPPRAKRRRSVLEGLGIDRVLRNAGGLLRFGGELGAAGPPSLRSRHSSIFCDFHPLYLC